VGGDDLQRFDVTAGASVPHGPVAAGVVADHAADGAAAVRGRVGSEGEAVRCDHVAQIVEHDPRLHARGAGVHVDVEHLVQVPGEVEHHTGTDGVARHARAAAPCGHRDVELAAGPQHRANVLCGPREGHGERWHAVVGGVVGVGRDPTGTGLQVYPWRDLVQQPLQGRHRPDTPVRAVT